MKPNMIKQIEDNLRHKVIRNVSDEILATLVFVLHDKWDWGDVRLDRLTTQVNELYDAILEGYVNFDDIKEANTSIPRTIRYEE